MPRPAPKPLIPRRCRHSSWKAASPLRARPLRCSPSPLQGTILAAARGAIDMDKEDPDRDETIKAVRGDINNWVARYRRDQQFSGRPSFG